MFVPASTYLEACPQKQGEHELRMLESQWAEVTMNNLNIDAACQTLEKELKRLKGEAEVAADL